MNYEDFKTSKSGMTIRQIKEEMNSSRLSSSGIHRYTKLIRQRTKDERDVIVAAVKAKLFAGGMTKPDVAFCKKPDTVFVPKSNPPKMIEKHFVKVYVDYVSPDKETVSG